MSCKERVVEQAVPVGLGLAVQQQVDGRIALAKQCGEQEDEQAEHRSANGQAHMGLVLETCEDAFGKAHCSDEIERHQATRDA